ncbi:hypothetical protein GH5_00935 [Leishmania sp. Ghana 2012 LV757]|uniref:hypothetical protein n=1 Tax=Leishmania sp. Ghana 2012 LV757 TaxID=2803181 RepID=UPI001B64FBEA|nr:hypothetical protein GH5_00935 [Leishmania sp. Ghana 2012 LV757]
MPPRITSDPGLLPTLVARPEDVFEDSGSGKPSAGPHVSSGAVVGERYDTAVSNAAATPPAKWDRDEALWQLKVALGVTPVLQAGGMLHQAHSAPLTRNNAELSMEPNVGNEAAAPASHTVFVSAKPSLTLQEGASGERSSRDNFIPPVYRFSSASPSFCSRLSNAYVQSTLARIQDECNALMQRFGVRDTTPDAEGRQANADVPDDELQAAQLMHLLAAPSTLAQLQRRADAAILEKEYVFRIRDLLAAELRRRHVPPEAAQEDFRHFLDEVDRTKMALDDYYHVQSAMHTMAPMMEAAIAVAECLHDVDATTSARGVQHIDAMESAVNSFLVQAQDDLMMLQKNMEALRYRFEAL